MPSTAVFTDIIYKIYEPLFQGQMYYETPTLFGGKCTLFVPPASQCVQPLVTSGNYHKISYTCNVKANNNCSIDIIQFINTQIYVQLHRNRHMQ